MFLYPRQFTRAHFTQKTLESQHVLANASMRKEARLVQNAGRATCSPNCRVPPPSGQLYSQGRGSSTSVYSGWVVREELRFGARAGLELLEPEGKSSCLQLICSACCGTCSVTEGDWGGVKQRQEGLGGGSQGREIPPPESSRQGSEPSFHCGPRYTKEQMAGLGAASAGAGGRHCDPRAPSPCA